MQSSAGPPLSPASVLSALQCRLGSPLVDLAGTERLLARLLREDSSELFSRPVRVTADIADYYERVPNPMDLSTLRTRFRAGQYATYQQLFDELERIWANCILYNGEPGTHPISDRAAALRDKARRALLQSIEQWERRDAFEGAASGGNDISDRGRNGSASANPRTWTRIFPARSASTGGSRFVGLRSKPAAAARRTSASAPGSRRPRR